MNWETPPSLFGLPSLGSSPPLLGEHSKVYQDFENLVCLKLSSFSPSEQLLLDKLFIHQSSHLYKENSTSLGGFFWKMKRMQIKMSSLRYARKIEIMSFCPSAMLSGLSK